MVRHKNRYLVIEINPADEKEMNNFQIKQTSFHSQLMENIQKLHGDFGIAATRQAYVAKYCNEKTRIAIIRARHGPHRILASCIPFIKRIEQKEVVVNTLYVGATIKQCYKFIRNHQQRKFEEICQHLKTDEEKEKLKSELMDFTKALSDL